MTDFTARRLDRLDANRELLAQILRGIEKEGLRVDTHGALAQTPHPPRLGAALTHPHITTDYSEALLELITAPHNQVVPLIQELDALHRYVYSVLDGEFIWNQSMPPILPEEMDIPIAQYGTSNTGQLKQVYRQGLAQRYGKTMQCIAGIHYNFSLDDRLWELLEFPGHTTQERRSNGYFGLMRNFTRYAWLLPYLFGATPALAKNFLRGRTHSLESLDADTLYLPYATSLRMSDLGYHNPAQAQLTPNYNGLSSFLQDLYAAVTQPWPAYQAIGIHRKGQWQQLNTHLLQIENEYYANIRPKQIVGRCERPITALASRGVQYVEVRCLDIDPFEAVGIAANTSYFLDAFLLFCATRPSPYFAKNSEYAQSADNFRRTVNAGRQPGLALNRKGKPVTLTQWGHELLNQILPYAQLLDAAYGGNAYQQTLQQQTDKLKEPESTPSARLLAALQRTGASFHDYTLAQSQRDAQFFRTPPLSPEQTAAYVAMGKNSWAEQKAIEARDTIDFDAYVLQYHKALGHFRPNLKPPLPNIKPKRLTRSNQGITQTEITKRSYGN